MWYRVTADVPGGRDVITCHADQLAMVKANLKKRGAKNVRVRPIKQPA